MDRSEFLQNAKSNAKTADDLELYTVKMKDGSTRVFSKSEIKANPTVQQMLVAQLKSQGRWPQKQAASA